MDYCKSNVDDDLLQKLASSVKVSTEPNAIAAPHPRLSEFKATFDGSQNKRRQDVLSAQKQRRFDAVNYARKLVDGQLDHDDLEAMDITMEEKRVNPFKYQLMLSEWLIEAPLDLGENWFMVTCPVGKRCLVVANRSNTSVYTKSGYCVMRFPSLLPGGCLNHFKYGEHSILDCIYSEVNHTFYVLDIMCWRGHPFYDAETEFRFFWLRTKLEEEPDLQNVSKKNPYKFVAIPCVPCSTGSIQSAVTKDDAFTVDGFLFYHRRLAYKPGRTPLIGWLKGHMIPEILGINLPKCITDKAPRINKLTLLKANNSLHHVSDREEKCKSISVSEEEMT